MLKLAQSPLLLQHPLFRDIKMCHIFDNVFTTGATDLVRKNGRCTFDIGNISWGTCEYGNHMEASTFGNLLNAKITASEMPLDDFTVAGWFRRTSVDTGRHYIVGSYDGTTGYVIRFGVLSNNILLTLNDGSYSNQNPAGHATSDGLWHFLVGVGTAGGAYLYYDGKLASSAGTGGHTKGGNAAWGIGGGTDESYPWDGEIVSTMAWNRPLTAEEVKYLYTLGPKLDGLTEELNSSFYGAAVGGGTSYNPAFAYNNNQVL